MTWLVFSYSLSAGVNSSSRVAVWRKLGRLGAVVPKAGVYVFPDKEDCFESLQWLSQEVQHAKGEAVVMRVNQFEGLSDAQLIKLFQEARKDDYDAVDLELDGLERDIHMKGEAIKSSKLVDVLKKIRSRFSDINQIDFFDSPQALRVRDRMNKLEKSLILPRGQPKQIPKASIGQYKDKRWVTRPHPHVDRLACAWLIRRFINLKAVIRYSNEPRADEVAFDMKGVAFGHQGNLCSFETMLQAFNLRDAGLDVMAEIIHEIDLKDGRYVRTEIQGVAAILDGWRSTKFTDQELELHGIALFEGLYLILDDKKKIK
jgi:hypothetical protein